MIYLIHGDDNGIVREKLHELLRVLAVKKPNAEVFRITNENWSKGQIDELAQSQGLFERKYIVVLDTFFSGSAGAGREATAVLLSKLEELKDSENVFIAVEGEIDAATLSKISKYTERVWKCVGEEIKIRKDFNVFALTDALGRRDKKNLWALYHRAIFAGSEPEELHGLLLWQVKALLLASKAQSAEDAGQKPFVWSKAKSFLKNYSEEELSRASSALVGIYHNARRGIVDFDIALEKFILKM